MSGPDALPDDAESRYRLGVACQGQGRLGDAAAHYRAAIAASPTHARAHNNLGTVLLAQGLVADAITSFAAALGWQRDLVDAWNNLGTAFARAGRLPEAIVAFERTLAYDPVHFNALTQRLFLSQQLAHGWDRLADEAEALRDGIRSGRVTALVPFPLLSLPALEAADHRAAAAGFAGRACGPALDTPPLCAAASRRRDRLRVGYLSQDFRTHPIAQLVVDVFERHDRARFEVVGYSSGPGDSSELRARIETACERFCDVSSLSDAGIARRIADDGIDILVDLGGFTTGARPGVAALRPAPVQVNWLGYVGTLGHPRLADYLIGDPTVTPLDHRDGYSETLALLPHCYYPTSPLEDSLPPATRREEGLPETGCVFCNFNQIFKITPQAFDQWCAVLKALPDAVLWLLAPSSEVAVRNLFREAERRGIAPERVLFAKRRPLDLHLTRLQVADVVLDSFPYTSHTTGTDALRAGVPIVTKIGTTFASRVAASLLRNVGLPELVTETWEDYRRLAVELGGNPAARAALKMRLLERRRASPLFDTDRFTADLERLYLRMWDDHLAGRKVPIALEAVP